jgi:hypothetical protein
MRSIACRLYAALFGALGVLATALGSAVLYTVAGGPAADGHAAALAQPLSIGVSTLLAASGIGSLALGLMCGLLALLSGLAARRARPAAGGAIRDATILPRPAPAGA